MDDKPINLPGVDGQVILAASEMGEVSKAHPEWLWHRLAEHDTSYGRWARMPGAAPYIRLDIALGEIKRLRDEIASLRADVDGAAHNRFYDQRDAYFEGLKDGK